MNFLKNCFFFPPFALPKRYTSLIKKKKKKEKVVARATAQGVNSRTLHYYCLEMQTQAPDLLKIQQILSWLDKEDTAGRLLVRYKDEVTFYRTYWRYVKLGRIHDPSCYII